jgi:hypothetical protein
MSKLKIHAKKTNSVLEAKSREPARTYNSVWEIANVQGNEENC